MRKIPAAAGDYDTAGRPVSSPTRTRSAAAEWLRQNPHRLALARLGLQSEACGSRPGVEQLPGRGSLPQAHPVRHYPAQNHGMENPFSPPEPMESTNPSAELLARLDQILAVLQRLAASLPTVAAAEPEPRQGENASAEAVVRSSPLALPAAPVTLIPDTLGRLLDSRGIRVRCVPPPSAADPLLDRLSFFLASRYQHLKPVLDRVKRTMQNGGSWFVNLAGRPQEVIASCCQFCYQLHAIAFLSEYRYHRSPRCVIEARSSTVPEAQNFFSGQWLERAIRVELARVAAEQGCELSMVANAQVVLPNHNDFELDLLACLGSSVLWIEAKTGDYQNYVRKYSQVARLLNLGPGRSILVLADVAPDVCTHLSALFGMTVLPPDALASHVRSLSCAGQASCAI